MAESKESKIVGYKKIFGFVLPDWVNESMIKNFGFGLLAMVVMAMVMTFVVTPNKEKMQIRESGLKKSESSLDLLRKSKEGLDRLRADLTTAEIERILFAMPQEFSPDTAIFSLRRISADTGVSIVSYTLPSGVLIDHESEAALAGADADMVGYSSFPIKLTVAAPVESLLKFIETVESSLPFGVVSDFNLQEVTKLSRANVSKNVQIALEIKYFQTSLRRVNLNKLESFTEEDMEMVGKLNGYNMIKLSQEMISPADFTATGSGSIFGF